MPLLKYSGLLIVITILLFYSCNTSRRGFYGKKSPHEKYGDGLESAGLRTTSLGAQWFVAADKSLMQPLSIQLPYKETGYFAAEKPRATGYRFTAQTGEKLLIKITTTPSAGVLLFTELWRPGANPEEYKLLDIADTTTQQLEYEVEDETNFIIRLQPELLKGVEYTLTISTQPSLAFPVHPSGKPRVFSLWGVERDGGTRSHEGIDIGAAFRTPALASADGRVTRVNENNLGGKVIFMNPTGKSYSLYYAHLDTQMVSPGQHVKTGDVLGLVGNTGNARTTPPHLHFGIYGANGAIDPFPFVNTDRPAIPVITASVKELNKFVHNRTAASLYVEPSSKAQLLEKLDADHPLQVISITEDWYKVVQAEDKEGFINSSSVTNTPVRQLSLTKETRLLDAPTTIAASKQTIPIRSNVSVLGQYKGYYFIEYEGEKGWIHFDGPV